MPLSVTSAVGITFACGSEVELISTKTAENTEWDWGCNDSNYETTAQDNAEQDAKTLVNDDLARQVALITCVSPCAKDVENPPRYNTDSKTTKDKCIPPTCTTKCWYTGKATVTGKVIVKCVQP